MGEFAAHPSSQTDPRRAAGLARNHADQMLQRQATILSPGTIPPGVLRTPHIPSKAVISSDVNFDRAVFAYDTAGYGPMNVFGSGSGWNRVGASGNDIRAYIGPTEQALYAWVWASFGWYNNSGATLHGRAVGCLYPALTGPPTVRASNPCSDLLAGTGYRELVWMGFFAIPADLDKDWNIGMQVQTDGGGAYTVNHTFNRQSIVMFLSAQPDDAADNTTTDAGLE